ncbi:hypothetical protein CN134_07710 [Sinorhizobium meliloti]|nr:hypothetical protein CN134_07710 [Sinorhizobium meliloti]
MSQATLAWVAFKNMMRAAARDPLWAFVALLSAPFRIWKPLLGLLFFLIIVLFVIGFGGRFVLEKMGFGVGSSPVIALDLVTLLVLAALAFRFITNPLILHFRGHRRRHSRFGPICYQPGSGSPHPLRFRPAHRPRRQDRKAPAL